MNWCFAIINGKLAEIYFEKEGGKTKIIGYCYVKKEEYKTKKEQRYIAKDAAKFQFNYRNGIYKDLLKPNQTFESTEVSR